MHRRNPSILFLLLLAAVAGVRTIGEAVSIAVFIGAIMVVSGMLASHRSANACAAGGFTAVFADCGRPAR